MRMPSAAILLCFAATAASADTCSDPTTAIRLANTRYRASVNEMRALQRDLPSAAVRGDEFGMRTVRRYGLALRDVKEQRGQILQLYRDLLAAECPPFDQEGFQQTRDDFRFYTDEEEKILSAVRRQMSQATAEN
jgi:hypothetical protein